MSHPSNPHQWGKPYEHQGTTYRECSQPDCHCHQQWVCALDRWSDTFETRSPRARMSPPEAAEDATKSSR